MNYRNWIFPYIKKYKFRILLIMLLSLLTIGAACGSMFTSGYLISAASMHPESILLVYVPIVLVRTFGLSRAVGHYVERLLSHDFILRVLSKMRKRLYNVVEPLAGLSHYKTGDVFGVLAEDIEALQDLFLRTIIPTVSAIFLYLIVILTLGFISLPFSLIMGTYIFLLVVVMPIFSLWRMKSVNIRYKHQRKKLYETVTDTLLGLSDWVISGQRRTLFLKYTKIEDYLDKADQKIKSWKYLRDFIGQVIVAAMITTMICLAATLFSSRQIEGELIAGIIIITLPLSEAFLPVSDGVEKIPQFEDSLKRINNMEQQAQSIKLKQQEVNQEHYEKSMKNVHLQVNHLSFQYENEDEQILADLCLDAQQGKKIAILGKSGAGKSTLLKVLQGILDPSEGTATINGYNIVEIKNDLPKLVSVLNQNPYLFHTSIENNLLVANEKATREEIIEVMKKVKLHDFIEALPDGYQTSMLETGQRFSGGERQRIALARVLLQDTPIVILDEPTVGLDPRTERDILDAIMENLHGKTFIWVTHHLTGMEKMDEILFLQEGKVFIRGTHEDLLANHLHYRRIYELDNPFIN